MFNLFTTDRGDKVASLQDTIMRGMSMADFRLRVTEEKVFINFGDESYMYSKPDNFTAERVIAAFTPSAPPDMPLAPLKLDEAALDG